MKHHITPPPLLKATLGTTTGLLFHPDAEYRKQNQVINRLQRLAKEQLGLYIRKRDCVTTQRLMYNGVYLGWVCISGGMSCHMLEYERKHNFNIKRNYFVNSYTWNRDTTKIFFNPIHSRHDIFSHTTLNTMLNGMQEEDDWED